jgi:hypothetical protein
MSDTAREQFVNDYLLVADNDYIAHKILMATSVGRLSSSPLCWASL